MTEKERLVGPWDRDIKCLKIKIHQTSCSYRVDRTRGKRKLTNPSRIRIKNKTEKKETFPRNRFDIKLRMHPVRR